MLEILEECEHLKNCMESALEHNEHFMQRHLYTTDNISLYRKYYQTNDYIINEIFLEYKEYLCYGYEKEELYNILEWLKIILDNESDLYIVKKCKEHNLNYKELLNVLRNI